MVMPHMAKEKLRMKFCFKVDKSRQCDRELLTSLCSSVGGRESWKGVLK